MNKNIVVITLIFVVFIVTEGSDASVLSRIRRMMTQVPISPSPAPLSETKADNSSTPVKPNVNVTENGTHGDKYLDRETIDERCEASTDCVKDMMTACIKHPTTGSQDFIILIQNEGERELIVRVGVPVSVEVSAKELRVHGHQVKKVNASIKVGESAEIVVNAGDGDCILHTGVVAVPQGNLFQNYAHQASPIHGAYLMFGVAVIIGGTWACCKIGKKGYHGGDGGVQYQELEMASPQSPLGAQDGWDQGWDDDWEEEGTGKEGVGSSNGLTSRSINKEDGWENDWDS